MRWENGGWFELLFLFRNIGLLVIWSGGRAGEVWSCKGEEIQVWVEQDVSGGKKGFDIGLTLTWHVGAFLRVDHEGVKHLKISFFNLDDVIYRPHLTGHDWLWGNTKTNKFTPDITKCQNLLWASLSLHEPTLFLHMPSSSFHFP